MSPPIDRYCPQCGAKQPQAFEYWPCQRCGYDVNYLSAWLPERPLFEHMPGKLLTSVDPAVITEYLSRSNKKNDEK